MSKALSLPRDTAAVGTLSSSRSATSLQPGRLRFSGAALLSRSLFSLRRPGRARQMSASVSDLARRVIDLRSSDEPPQGTESEEPTKALEGVERPQAEDENPDSEEKEEDSDGQAFNRACPWHQKVYRSLKPKMTVRGRSPGRVHSRSTTRSPTCFLCSGGTASTGFIIVHGHYLHISCLRCAR